MNYQAVLFDFDYTLGDATQSIVAGATYGLTQMGWDAPTLEQVRATVGYPLEEGYTMLTGDADPEHRARFKELFREKAHPIQAEVTRLFPGALELLDALTAAGVKTAVVSTKHTATLTEVLERTGVLARVSFALGSDDVHHAKPDPEGILLGLTRLGVAPEQALYCGDTVMDAEAASRAGCGFCAVLNGTTPESAFDVWPTAHVARDLPDLKHWLGL